MFIIFALIIIFLLFKLFASTKQFEKKQYNNLNTSQIKILENNVLYYQKLSQENKAKFSKRVAQFLLEVKIKSISCSLSQKDIVYIGASAVIPVFGFENWTYNNLKIVYVLPDAFNKKFQYKGFKNNRNILGMVGNGPLKDKMLISQKALRHGFDNNTDKNNTAIHEFVHLIDMIDGDIDGLPKAIMEQPYALPWFNLIHEKITAIDQNESDINPYGATSKIEFFAVASEYFFERPKLLKRKHPQLYTKLAIFFNQDLAS